MYKHEILSDNSLNNVSAESAKTQVVYNSPSDPFSQSSTQIMNVLLECNSQNTRYINERFIRANLLFFLLRDILNMLNTQLS